MNWTALELPGVFLLELEPHADARGFFARTFDRAELATRGLDARIEQTSLSFNPRRGTLRGLHWQAAPYAEAKLVRSVRGRIHDVAVDIRPDSPTFRRHVGVDLDAELRNALYIPAGVAHGFLTLTEDCEVHYTMSVGYAPEAGRGARYDDPAFGIRWPADVELVSERDLGWPPFSG